MRRRSHSPALAIATTGALLSLVTYLGCGDDDSGGGAGASSSTSSGGSSSGTSSGASSSGAGSSSGGTSSSGGDMDAGDAGRVFYPPGAGSVSTAGGTLTCMQGNWTREAVPFATTSYPVSAVGRGDDLYALFGSTSITYAKRTISGTWTSESGPTGVTGANVQGELRFDSDGNAHTALTAYSNAPVTYATRTAANTWSTSVVVNRQATGTSLVVDPTGQPFVAVDGLGNANGDLEVYRRDADGGDGGDAGWTMETAGVTYMQVKDIGPRLVLTPGGPLVCWAGTSSFAQGIGCAARSGVDGGWSPLAGITSVGQSVGQPSVARAGDGTLHLAFHTVGFVQGTSQAHYTIDRAVFSALPDGGYTTTTEEELDQATEIYMTPPRLVRDDGGAVHILYVEYTFQHSALKYIHIAPDGTAVGNIVACDVQLAFDIAITNAGPIVVYPAGLTGASTLMAAHP